MPKKARFWRNVILIGLAHSAVIVGLVRSSQEHKIAAAQSVVWMSGGGSGGSEEVAVEKKPRPNSTKPPLESKAEPSRIEEPEEERPVLTSAPSEIRLPNPKPSPASTSSPKPTPKLKVPPKPTPKPKPRPTPKPSPRKIILAKASPKPSPKIRPTPAKTHEEQTDADVEEKKIAQAESVKNAPGAGDGHAGGAGGESQFGWYGSMLHDRFYSEWIQPTTVASAGAKSSVLVKIRIEHDGRVSSFEIIKPSGNGEVDQSVAAVAKRVTQVDPLPAGLGKGDHYDVKINFELNSE
jgi:TonB family protein